MDGFVTQPLSGIGAGGIIYAGSFQTKAGSDPASANFRAPPGLKAFTVAYTATGIYTVTLPAGMILPEQPCFVAAWPQFATLATDWFECGIVGESTLNATTRQFVVQAHRNGTAREVADTAGNRVNFAIYSRNSTGL